jgi:pimeloyl-ACP methyl ester carboxylesterase
MRRPTVLFLPGLLCDGALWRHQAESLADAAECRVADVAQDSTVEAMARRALDSVEGMLSVCGLSMGGYVAMALMRIAPERVERLCLMDTGARADTPERTRLRRGQMELARTGRLNDLTPLLLPLLVHPDRAGDAALAAEVLAMAERVGPDAFLRQQEAIIARPDSRPFLPQIGVPTLVAVGAGDQLTPPDLAQEIATLIPHSELRLLDDAGHLPPLETPGAVNATLRNWLT